VAHRKFEIRGKVIDTTTGHGAQGLTVEAWDKDLLFNDLVGKEVTDSNGEFRMKFDESYFQDIFGDSLPDLFFVVYLGGDLLTSTETSVLWNVNVGTTLVQIPVTLPVMQKVETDIYLKIEPINDYNPVNPVDHVPAGVKYKRDCMQHGDHHSGVIPGAEVDARAVEAVVYREYLDPDYLIPKVDKLVEADINEPAFHHRVPGTVIYARPGDLLRLHVYNADGAPHSLHLHGLLYGIDSDGSWPFGTQSKDGRRSDEICPGQTWTYTFCATEETVGVWPFHDHTQHGIDESINRGLFGGIVVLPKDQCGPAIKEFGPLEDLKKLVARFKVPAARLVQQQRKDIRKLLEWIKERWQLELVKPVPRFQKVLLVPLFFHVMKSHKQKPKFDTNDIEELGGSKSVAFNEAGVFDYFCQIHPAMTGKVRVEAGGPATATVNIVPGPPPAFSPNDIPVGIGGTVTWVNQTQEHHTATSKDGASIATHCFNGRGFTGNSPTIVGYAGQKIHWYVFNLDIGTEWHNFHPHSSRWKLGAETIDVRSIGPAESFMVESEIPSPLLLTDDIKAIQKPKHRPENAKLYDLKADFLVHCHVHHHMMNGMAGLIRAKQRVWLTPEMVKEIEEKSGLPVDDFTNNCPKVDHHRCEKLSAAKVEQVPGSPEVIMMHSALLPGNETVLFWGKDRPDQSRLWNAGTGFSPPANQPALLPGENSATSNLWSAAHAFLADGRLLAHGGLTQGTGGQPTKTYLYDANAAAPWSQTDETADARFYASTITLADGHILTMQGTPGGFTPVSNTIEVYDPAAGTWSPPKAMPATFDYLFYPWLYLLPDGELFIAGPQEVTRKFDWTANPIVDDPTKTFNTNTGDRGDNMNGTSVLLTLRPPDYKPVILIMGGSPMPARKSTEVMDLSAAVPAWAAIPGLDLKQDRVNCTAVLLPNGHVFIAGGIFGIPDGGPVETLDTKNMAAGWQVGPKLAFPRLYHSSMILLPDGSVFIGGDDDGPDPCERYYPSYYNQPRPQILNALPNVAYTAAFTIQTPQAGSIAEVILMRPGAVTHGFDMSQRAIELAITASGVGTVDVVAPSNGNVAPPGFYLLFILDGNRVPSVARWIHLGP
jgi:plastocyanin